MERYTLHIRLTHACNADCSYCSSRISGPAAHMSLKDFEKSCHFIAEELLPLLGHESGKGHISIQYVGGEILTVPSALLERQVKMAREIFSRHFASLRDGAQTNLIGSAARVEKIEALFEGRIGTSIDNFTKQRTAKGSADVYRQISGKRQKESADRLGRPVPGVLVVDKASLPHLGQEVEMALAERRGLTLRTVFDGGSDTSPADIEDIRKSYLAAAEDWLASFSAPIEPFQQLFSARAARANGNIAELARYSGCPFQTNCARLSLNLEPDGSLYVCQDMADSGQYKLGNAVDGQFETGLWAELDARRDHLDTECKSCPWRRECQGGCMSEAIHHTGSIYGRTRLCPVWKSLFSRFDKFITEHGAEYSQACARKAAGGEAHPAVQTR